MRVAPQKREQPTEWVSCKSVVSQRGNQAVRLLGLDGAALVIIGLFASPPGLCGAGS